MNVNQVIARLFSSNWQQAAVFVNHDPFKAAAAACARLVGGRWTASLVSRRIPVRRPSRAWVVKTSPTFNFENF